MPKRLLRKRLQASASIRKPKGWEPVADWYVGYMGKEGGAYQRDVIFPGAERLLQLEKNGVYLDIACGQGVFTKRLAKDATRTVHGFDISPSLIAEAKINAPRNVHFRVADAMRFASLYPASSFDGAVCNLAIQNIDQMEPVFADAARVLKPGGTLILTMNHPAFRQPRQSGWGWDEERKLQYRRVDKYLEPYEMPILAHPGSAPTVKTYSYHRPISAYVNALAKHGLLVDALEEWISNRVSDSGPKAKAENIARKEIPLFLAIRARKV